MTARRIIAVCIPLILAAAWIAGARRAQNETTPHLLAVVPGAQTVSPAGNGDFEVHGDGRVIGYARLGRSRGFGGPLVVATGIDTTGSITGTSVVEHRESAAFYGKVIRSGLAGSLAGKSAGAALRAGVDVDAVTGATVTSEAVVTAVQTAAHELGARRLGLEVRPQSAPPVRFGWPEVVLVVLFAAGIAGSYTPVPGKKPLRWVTRIAGLVFIGFVYCAPVTITHINSLLTGYLPDWRGHLYWYLLVTGVLLPVILTRRSPWCNYVCPFGAAQDCLQLMSGQSRGIPVKVQKTLRWLHGFLVLAAVFAAVYARNPGLTSYEVFGAMFDLTGLTWQFVLLGIVLIMALFFARPWCRFLCPIQGVTRYAVLCRSLFRAGNKKAPQP